MVDGDRQRGLPRAAGVPLWRLADALMVFLDLRWFGLSPFFTTLSRRQAVRARAGALRQVNAELLATRFVAGRVGARRRAELRDNARELHDVVGHRLTALSLNSCNCSPTRAGPRGAARVMGSRGTDHGSARRHPPGRLAVAARHGLDLRERCRNWRRRSCDRRSRRSSRRAPARPTPIAPRVVLRAAQEGLTNAVAARAGARTSAAGARPAAPRWNSRSGRWALPRRGASRQSGSEGVRERAAGRVGGAGDRSRTARRPAPRGGRAGAVAPATTLAAAPPASRSPTTRRWCAKVCALLWSARPGGRRLGRRWPRLLGLSSPPPST